MKIQNRFLAGQEVIVSKDVSRTGKLKFNEDGIAEVSEEVGEDFLKLDGYKAVKTGLFPTKSATTVPETPEETKAEDVGTPQTEEKEPETTETPEETKNKKKGK